MRCHMDSPSNQKSVLILVFSHQFMNDTSRSLSCVSNSLTTGLSFLS